MMNWETVKIDSSRQGKNTAYASIGFGRIVLNSAACELVDNFSEYKYVQILKARKDGKLCVGIKLLKDCKENSIKIGKRKIKGAIVEKSLSIDNKPLMEDLFGIQGTQNKATRYPVVLDDDDKSILVIYGK